MTVLVTGSAGHLGEATLRVRPVARRSASTSSLRPIRIMSGRLATRSRYSSCLLDSRRRSQSKEYEHSLIEAQDILVVQASDMRTDLGFRDCGYLVHHEAAGDAQSIALVRLDRKPEQGCVRLVGVNAQIVMESVPSKLSSCRITTGAALPA